MEYKYIQTVQDLLDLFNSIEDKSQQLSISGIVGIDSNCRNNYEHFFKAKIWDPEITHNGYELILE